MRRLLMLAVVGCTLFVNSGCLLNALSSDPNVRTEQLLFWSEDLRQIRNEWRRFWFTDQPSHMTYERIHGGIGP